MSARCPSLAVGVWGSAASLLCGAEAFFIFVEFASTATKDCKVPSISNSQVDQVDSRLLKTEC